MRTLSAASGGRLAAAHARISIFRLRSPKMEPPRIGSANERIFERSHLYVVAPSQWIMDRVAAIHARAGDSRRENHPERRRPETFSARGTSVRRPPRSESFLCPRKYCASSPRVRAAIRSRTGARKQRRLNLLAARGSGRDLIFLAVGAGRSRASRRSDRSSLRPLHRKSTAVGALLSGIRLIRSRRPGGDLRARHCGSSGLRNTRRRLARRRHPGDRPRQETGLLVDPGNAPGARERDRLLLNNRRRPRSWERAAPRTPETASALSGKWPRIWIFIAKRAPIFCTEGSRAHRAPPVPMRCSTLAELPPPPAGKTGWPWTVETPRLPPARPDGSPWPRISIVTPSYNQGQFIEETIRSVLLQGYPDLEYIIIDGGSTDESVEIIKRYEPWLAYWVSEKDRGAPDAINKGFARSRGAIYAWLNSDDTYTRGALSSVAIEFFRNRHVDIISGICRIYSRQSPDLFIGPSPLRTLEDFCRVASNWTKQKLIIQPEAFFTREIYQRAGPLQIELLYCYDVIFWVKAADLGAVFTSVARHWADLRRHADQKTADLNFAYRELARSVFDYCRAKPDMHRDQLSIICAEVIALLDHIAGEENARARRYKESTSYRVGRMVTRIRFW